MSRSHQKPSDKMDPPITSESVDTIGWGQHRPISHVRYIFTSTAYLVVIVLVVIVLYVCVCVRALVEYFIKKRIIKSGVERVEIKWDILWFE